MFVVMGKWDAESEVKIIDRSKSVWDGNTKWGEKEDGRVAGSPID